jgi:hypothetical protein
MSANKICRLDGSAGLFRRRLAFGFGRTAHELSRNHSIFWSGRGASAKETESAAWANVRGKSKALRPSAVAG